jgi:tetratricopeptide (TPR) repeat protein
MWRSSSPGACMRRMSSGWCTRTSPRDFLVRALKADGWDPAEAGTLLSPRNGSRWAQAIADLAGYEEARRIYERLLAAGRKDLERELASLCMGKAFIHAHFDDAPGALAMYDRAIELYERLVHQEGRRELRGDLVWVQANKAVVLLSLGERGAASALARQAIAVLKEEVQRTRRADLKGVLDWATNVFKGVL